MKRRTLRALQCCTLIGLGGNQNRERWSKRPLTLVPVRTYVSRPTGQGLSRHELSLCSKGVGLPIQLFLSLVVSSSFFSCYHFLRCVALTLSLSLSLACIASCRATSEGPPAVLMALAMHLFVCLIVFCVAKDISFFIIVLFEVNMCVRPSVVGLWEEAYSENGLTEGGHRRCGCMGRSPLRGGSVCYFIITVAIERAQNKIQ